MENFLAVFLVLLCLVVIFFAIRNIMQANKVNYLPKWLWVLVCVISFPLGVIIYYFLGKPQYENLDE